MLCRTPRYYYLADHLQLCLQLYSVAVVRWSLHLFSGLWRSFVIFLLARMLVTRSVKSAFTGNSEESFAGLSSQLLDPTCGYVYELSEATLPGQHVDTLARTASAGDRCAHVQPFCEYFALFLFQLYARTTDTSLWRLRNSGC